MDETATTPSAGPTHRRHHWWRIGIMTVAAVVALGAFYTVGRYALRSHPGPKSVDAAVDELRASGSTTDTGSSSFTRPAGGVYEASGEGGEHISTPPNSQTDGPTIPITLRWGDDGCWTWHIDFNSAHWHEFDYCPRGDQLLLVKQTNYQAWDFGAIKAENLGPYTCDPAAPVVVTDPQPGQSFQHHCTGENSGAPGLSTMDGPVTIVGTELLTIGGEQVPAIHQHRVQAMTGAQDGTTTEDWWFAPDTGLPLRAERNYELRTKTIIGPITYTEHGSWQLTSLTPRT